MKKTVGAALVATGLVLGLGLVFIKFNEESEPKPYVDHCRIDKLTPSKFALDEGETYKSLWPWSANIYIWTTKINSVTLDYTCTGTLISEKFVLVAEHCLMDESNETIKSGNIVVELGIRIAKADNDIVATEHDVSSVHRYGEIDLDRNSHFAILELSGDVTFNEKIYAACLAQDIDYSLVDGPYVGWIRRPNQAVEDEDAFEMFKYDWGCFTLFNNNGSLSRCKARDGTALCLTESTGSLFYEINENLYFVGSYTKEAGNECNSFSMAVFTNSWLTAQWINEKTKLNLLRVIERKTSQEVQFTAHNNSILPKDCGKLNQDQSGKQQLCNFPWIALLGFYDMALEKNNFFCVGTIINNRYVITSKECANFKYFFVRLGGCRLRSNCDSNDVTKCDLPGHDYEVEHIVEHPHMNSIVLIRLEKDILFSDSTQPACLPTTENLGGEKSSRYTLVTMTQSAQPILEPFEVVEIGFPECNDNFVEKHNPKELLCTEGVGYHVDKHRGHLGRFVKPDGQLRFVLYGINIEHYSERFPLIYLGIKRYVDWIVAYMEK
ncbi:uncharacterized protein LOC119766554 [Culex quinquefasciatus]|uniref:uncharacterized protein LOC119766554 n=1 Tax=Culex quinquefasciatus TaxID=7176 RepID=UPI0018E37CC3|nr:uncharacterized protein LOC119766554 [Culex quinquefasciatus]